MILDETISLGYSSFCPLFTEAEFMAYGYTYDLEFYVSLVALSKAILITF